MVASVGSGRPGARGARARPGTSPWRDAARWHQPGRIGLNAYADRLAAALHFGVRYAVRPTVWACGARGAPLNSGAKAEAHSTTRRRGIRTNRLFAWEGIMAQATNLSSARRLIADVSLSVSSLREARGISWVTRARLSPCLRARSASRSLGSRFNSSAQARTIPTISSVDWRDGLVGLTGGGFTSGASL